MRQLGIVLLFIILTTACKQTPEQLIEKARRELARENHDNALSLLHQAFELSLSQDFHFRPISEKFSQLYTSRLGNRVLLIPLEDNPKVFQLFDDFGKLLCKGKTKAPILKAGISPAGDFLIFLTGQANQEPCQLTIYDTQQEKFIDKVELVDCSLLPAISDNKVVPFMYQEKLFLHTAGNNTIEIKQKPEKPLAKLPAYAAFYFNRANYLFFTYGSAGVYKFYYLDTKQNHLTLIHRDVSTSRITFNATGLEPGVIIGGAGNMTMHFFNPQTLKPTGKIWKTNAWNEIVILDDHSRFYTENASLFEYQNGTVKELPFWAYQLQPLSQGRLLFLSATGAVTLYSGIEPSAGSIAIYKKGAELDERK